MIHKYPCKVLLAIIILIIFNGYKTSFAQQAPDITYQSPQNYTVNTPIAPLTPTNSGGAIPNDIYGVTTFAGNTGTNVTFYYINSVKADGSGNVYVTDRTDRILKITPDGLLTVIAGLYNTAGYADGQGAAALFNGPQQITTDPSGNIYVADAYNNVIRKVTLAGAVTTYAGTGAAGSNDGPAATATFDHPAGLAFDSQGDLFVSDFNTSVIRKITPSGVVSTFAGIAKTPGAINGMGSVARFSGPGYLTVDASDNIYVSDLDNSLIRKITPAGLVSTFAGSGKVGYDNGMATVASFNQPQGLAVDAIGNVYVADEGNDVIRKITPAGLVSTFAGTGVPGFLNSSLLVSRFNGPMDISIGSSGNFYIADELNNDIRKITPGGYTIDKALPPGLIFDPSTGTISGTPTVTWPATDYTITAYNIAGSSSSTVSITVNNILPATTPPAISYQTPLFYSTNETITPLIPVNTGGAVPPNVYGQISTFAGNGAAGSANGQGKAAYFTSPANLSSDASGNLYVTDATEMVRMITPDGTVTTIAGNAGTSGYKDAQGTSALFNAPAQVAINALGDLYVADEGNNVIRKIAQTTHIVTTFAGTGAAGINNGQSTSATFNHPFGIVVNGAGNLYVADFTNNVIRMITPAGMVSTFAGSGSQGSADGTGNQANFAGPTCLAIDATDNIYVSDSKNNLIRKITPAGVVSTLAGSGSAGSADGTGNKASFNQPGGIAIDAAGNLYVADIGNNLVRKISPAGVVITIAGNYPGATGSDANFSKPSGIVIDASGNAYVTEAGSNIISKLVLTGYVINKALPAGLTFTPTTGVISGTPTAISPATDYIVTAYNAGGSSSALFNITVNNIVNVQPPAISYVSPQTYFANKTIISLMPQNGGGAVPATVFGQVSTFAGTVVPGSSNGAGSSASFRLPSDIAVDQFGQVYVADAGNNLIRTITPAGVVSTWAGSGAAGFADGQGTSAIFQGPAGVTVDRGENLYIADKTNNLVRKIDPAGKVTTLAGNPGVVGFADGTGTAASFNYPTGIAVDAAGNVDVADQGNELIRTVSPAGVVTTIAGQRKGGSADGPGTQATFNSPEAIAIDNAGNMYVADYFNNTIRKVTPSGLVTTIAGSLVAGSADGQANTARFNNPNGIDVDAAGNIYIADMGNNSIRMMTPQGNVITLAGNGKPGYADGVGAAANFNKPTGLSADGTGNVFVADEVNNVVRKVVATGYTIDKQLPAGLTFDPTTGIISGTPLTLSPATNYTVTAYNAGGNSSFTVNIAVITLTAQTLTFAPIPAKTYGDPDFSPGAASTNNTIPITYSSDNPSIATIVNSQIHITGAGTANITASQDGNDNFSAANPVTQPLTINQAPLTITTNNYTKTVGQENPVFVPTYTGFVYGEGPAQLTHLPELTTLATTNSPVGQYPITVSGATSLNYAITPVDGILTIVAAPPSITVPNAFTPNGDGINDYWDIQALTSFPQCQVSVYARNGSLVFQSKGYPKPWDGTYKGSPLPDGTYYYVINPQSGMRSLSGYVTILR